MSALPVQSSSATMVDGGAGTTVTFVSGTGTASTVYYGYGPGVSSTSNAGSLTAGQSVALVGPAWFIAGTAANGSLGSAALAETPTVTAAAAVKGNRVAMLGDSITIANTGANDNLIRGDKDPLLWAHLLSDGKVGYHKNAGITGNKLSDMQARLQADVITAGPDWCVIMSGTNDASNGVTAQAYATTMQAIVASLQTAGIKPAICTPPPNPSGAQRKTAAQYDQWIRAYCHRAGVPMIDVRAGLIDSTTGGYASGFDGGDGIHPTNVGAQVIGQAIANALSPLLNPFVPPLPKFDTADTTNLLSGGMFLTNTAGVGTGWTKSGLATASIVAAAGGDAVGNWQRLADTVNEFSQVNSGNIAVGANFAIGDRVALCGRLRSNVTNGQAKLNTSFNGAATTIQQVINPGLGSTTAHSFYFEVTVPAGTTSINFSIQTQAGTGVQIDAAQLGVFNLTQAGLTQ